MKTKLICIVLLFFGLIINVFATNNSEIDSLSSVLQTTKNQKLKLSLYDQIINKLVHSNPDSALKLSEKYLNLATEQNDNLQIAKAQNAKGLSYFIKSNYRNAAQYFIKAIELFEKEGQKYDAAVALNNLAASYEHIESPQTTIRNFLKAHEIFKEINNTHWIGISAGNLSNNYLVKLNDLKNAEKYAKIAVESAKKTGDKIRQAESHLTLGNVLYTGKQYEKASESYGKISQLISLDSYPIMYGSAKVNQASCLTETANYDQALKYYNEALNVFKKQKHWMYVSMTYQGIIDVYQRKKDYKSAFEAQKQFLVANDSLQANQKRNEMIDALKKYETEKKEKENQLLVNQLKFEKQFRFITISGILLLVILILVIGISLSKNRNKNKKLAQQNELISQQKDRLVELNDEKNRLIGIVSHDIRTPFNSIILWGQSLKNYLKNEPLKAQESTEAIIKLATQGQQMVNQILDIERLEIADHNTQLSPTPIHDLVSELIADFGPACKGKGISLELINNVDQKKQILTNPELLRRAIENLISNALKFSHPGSKVGIELSEKDQKLNIAVVDQGVGIAQNELQNLFKAYSKTSSSPTGDEESTGLGLHIVKRIMDELGGQVMAHSVINQGSTFTLSLPV